MQTSARPRAPLRVERLTRLAELHALRDEWESLMAADPSATVFQTWEWVTSWYEHFGVGRSLAVLTVRDEHNRLVGIAPSSLSSTAAGTVRLLHLLGRGNALTEYVEPVLHQDYREATTRAILDAWEQLGAEWHLLVLSSVPGDGPFVGFLRDVAEARGYRTIAQETVRVTRPLPESWQAFYRSLRKSMKENANNYVNRLHREGHHEQMVVIDDPARLDWVLDVFFDLHRRRALAQFGRRHHDYFAHPVHRAFLRTAARRLLERGAIWPCLLYIDGVPVAAQICLLHDGRVYTYYSGFDPAWAQNGVMTVLTRRCIERAIEHGYRELDQLLGMDQEKLRWGGQTRPVVNLILAGPRFRSRAAMWLYEWNREGRRLATQAVASAERARNSAQGKLQRRRTPEGAGAKRRTLATGDQQ